MAILYLQLAKYKQDDQCGVVLGLSIDENPSQDARAAGMAPIPPSPNDLPSVQVQSVALQPEQATVIMFRALPQEGNVDPNTVVITVKPVQDDTDPSAVISFNISLVKDTSDLVFECTKGHGNLVVLSPELMRIGQPTPTGQCIALLENRETCRLTSIDMNWRPAHHEYHQFLDEQLEDRNLWLEKAIQSLDTSGDNDALDDANDQIQTSLELHIMISEILQAGYKDGNQVALFDKAKQDRVIVAQKLSSQRSSHRSSHRSDGLGRMSTSSITGGLLGQLKERECHSESRERWRPALVVNLTDVDTIQSLHDRVSSVSELFGGK